MSTVAVARTIACCLVVLAISTAAQAYADDKQQATSYAIHVRSCDEVWIVSSRQLNPCNFTPQQLCVWQLRGESWQPSVIDDLIQVHRRQPDKPLVIYVHGSRLDFYWARRRGLETYQDLTAAAAALPPIRFVIWAWPSEDHDHMVINYPRNLQRSMQEGNVLGWFLAAAGEGQRIGVLGYSLGVQALGSACEVAHRRYAATACCRAAAIGAVTNCCWPHSADQAHAVLAGMGKMLVVDNQQDRAVSAFQRGCQLRRPGSPQGLDWLEQHDRQQQMQRLDVTDVVEREHQIHEYLKHPCIARCVADQLVGREPHVAADSIRPDALPVADWETFEHYEPGNPASNPRRKPFTSK